MQNFDVVIVGARCAGAPLGTLLARAGRRVAVLEQATFPLNTLSSHCIQADALAFLDRLGVTERIRATGAPYMTRTDCRLDNFRFIADLPLEPGDVGGAACVRRHLFDQILAEAATAAGADVRMGTKVTGIIEQDGRVAGVRFVHNGTESEIRARLVVGADGRNSTIARLCGARRYNVTNNERWYYWSYFEGADLAAPHTFVFHRWGDRHIFAGPSDNGLYLVGVSPERHEKEEFRHDLRGSLLRHAQSCAPVAAALADAHLASKIYGITRFSGYFREASGPGWVLVGDAGHFKDPAAGRGIGDAFRQVEGLVPLILTRLDGSPAALDQALTLWARWRDRTYAEYYWLAADIGAAGPLAGVVPAAIRRLHERGRINEFLRLFSHRNTPSRLLTPGRVAGAAAQVLSRPDTGRRAFLNECRGVLAAEVRHRRLARHPDFAMEEPCRPRPIVHADGSPSAVEATL